MMSREGEERECGVLSARDGLGVGCFRQKRLEGLGGVLGTACNTSLFVDQVKPFV
jgi:hypothetical protein